MKEEELKIDTVSSALDCSGEILYPLGKFAEAKGRVS
jgi:hypothetical protein